MKLILQRLSIVALSVLAVPVLAVAPAYARQGSDDTSGTSAPAPTTLATTSETETENETETEVKPITKTEIKSRVEAYRLKAEDQIKEMEAKKTEVKTKTQEERKKSCEARSAELTKKLNKKVADATKHQAVFDKIYNRVTEFYKTKNLNVSNYATLTANVDAAKAKSAASIDTLKGISTTVDCTQVDAAATNLATFKAALKDTRDSLKAYRTSIKDLIVAVKGSLPEDKTSTSTTTESSTETTTNNTNTGN